MKRIAIGLLLLSLLVSCAGPATPPPLAAVPTPTVKPLPPVVFVMLDWTNGDWGNPDYRYSYVDKAGYRQEFKGHPEWGALGGWTPFKWRDLNPSPGVYDWSKPDAYIKAAAAMRVTLPDGSVIPKPVGIAVELWAQETVSGRIGETYIPSWVGVQCGSVTSCVDPDKASGPCLPYCVPKVSNACLVQAFDEFVLAMGAHYDGNPEFDNLAFINIATGADEETVERKDMNGCSYYGGNSPAFDEWCLHVMETYNRAFPTIPQFIQSTLHSTPYHVTRALSLSGSTGVKVNGLEVSHPNGIIQFNGQTVAGVTGFSQLLYEHAPTGYEPAHGNGVEGSYWYMMEGLFAHPHMMDIQLRNIEDTRTAELRTGFDILDFARVHFGTTVQTTPDVWCVLREASNPTNCWTGSDGIRRCYGPWRGDFTSWLYRSDSAPNSRTVVVRSGLPANHVYSFQPSRRTDQATGNTFMSFDIDDAWPLVGSTANWLVEVVFVNAGTDMIALEHQTVDGEIVSRQIRKGAQLGPVGQWVTLTWILPDAQMANGLPGGADFRINCVGDGDEIVHRVIVRPGEGQGSVPTTLPNPSATAVSTATATVAPRATESATATVAVTTVPTATASRTATPRPTWTATMTATPGLTNRQRIERLETAVAQLQTREAAND